MKQVIEDSRRTADEHTGRKVSKKYKKDAMLYWKKVKDEKIGE